jgi:hypothetical protein
MSWYNRFCRLCFYAVILALLQVGCDRPSPTKTVLVTFEIQLINARATSYSLGLAKRRESGTTGFGAVNEVIRKSYYADVGDLVFAWAVGSHWNKADPAHQIICRIIVDGKEIYIDAAQGTPGEETKVECKGPVYIPKKNNETQRRRR